MGLNYRAGPGWLPGTVIERNGPLSYLIKVSGGQLWRRYIDQLREVDDTPAEHPSEQLQENKRWQWSKHCGTAFAKAKQLLSEAPILAHFDPKLPLCLAGDASAYGVGAVLSHRYPNGEERPIAYASRTLSSSEKNYAQLEREALSLIFGVQKFHQFLYGRSFMLYTDHKPLTVIFNPKKGIPPLSAARLQQWSIILSAYDYTIAFKPTQLHGNADGLSRLPLLRDKRTV